jgi:hypothetical protein
MMEIEREWVVLFVQKWEVKNIAFKREGKRERVWGSGSLGILL